MLSYRITVPAVALGFVVMAAGSPAVANDYTIDPEHSQANFIASHVGFSNIHGRFNEESGTISFDPDNIEASTVEVVIQTASVDTNHEARDEHLRSPDFFNAAEFPEMTFTSTKVEQTGENTGKITGDLTLLGVTREVTMDAMFHNIGSLPWDDTVEIAAFSATTMINRADFGMTYGTDEGGEEIEIILTVEGNRPL